MRAQFFSCLCILLAKSTADTARTDGTQRPIKAAAGGQPWFEDAFDDFVEKVLSSFHVPGLSVAVMDNGDIFSKVNHWSFTPSPSVHLSNFLLTERKGYGIAEFPDRLATADTQYMTGSTTKAFTAAAAALLAHNKSYPDFKWSSPVQNFIREDFVLGDEYATAHITIEDALSHRTGLSRHDFIEGQEGDTPSDLVRRLRYLPVTAEPRTLWRYCNLMYAVMTDVLETVYGVGLETIFRNHFWKPLGMLSTTFDPHAEGSDGTSRHARGYYWNLTDRKCRGSDCEGDYVPEPYDDNSANPGAGAIYSTVNDYALWIKAFLEAADPNTPPNASSPITPSLFRDMTAPRAILPDIVSGQDPDYGFMTPPLYALGWMTVQILGETIVTHSGAQTGFGTNVYVLPARGLGIVTMGNTVGTSNYAGSEIALRVLLRKLNLTGAYGEETVALLQQSLRGLSEATIPPSKKRHRAPENASAGSRKISISDPFPLPGQLADYAGQYLHPAYGSINLTLIHQPSPSSDQSGEYLEGLIYPRIWPLKFQLYHRTDTVFDVKYFSPHGLGDIVSGDGIVWEDESGDEKAAFVLDLDGRVEMLGLEIDEGMIEAAREKGGRFWREGMIWFERMR